MADVSDVPLPGMPEPADLPEPPTPSGVHVRRYRPALRALCSDCVREIHTHGVANAPVPMSVRWQVSKGSLTLHLCEGHKITRLKEWNQ